MFATLYIFTLIGLVLKLVGDLTYMLVDPRIDFEAARGGCGPLAQLAAAPLVARRLANFRANRRGYCVAVVFLALFFVSLFAELIANDRPLLVRYEGAFYFRCFATIPETTFGGVFETEADYTDPEVAEADRGQGLDRSGRRSRSATTRRRDLAGPAPSPPRWQQCLGTDDQARDVVARVIYGFRISVLFGLALTILSSVIGVAAGAVQGYFGGLVDLCFQRFMEIWAACRCCIC